MRIENAKIEILEIPDYTKLQPGSDNYSRLSLITIETIGIYIC